MFTRLRSDDQPESGQSRPLFSDDQQQEGAPSDSPSVESDQAEPLRRRISLKNGKTGRFGFVRWLLLALVVVVCVYFAFNTITGMINDAIIVGKEIGIAEGINIGRLLEKCETLHDPLACQAVIELTSQ